MKKKKVLGIMMVMMCMVGMMFIGTISEAATKIEPNKTKTLYVTKGKTVTIQTKNKNKVTWKVTSGSSKAKIVAKDSKKTCKTRKIAVATIKGLKKGTAVIKASKSGKSYIAKVVVETPSISNRSVTIKQGKSKTVSMKNTKRKATWKSSNTSIATVSDGTITGKKAGTTTITATLGGKTYKCVVEITKDEDVKKEESQPTTTEKTMYDSIEWDMIGKAQDSNTSPWGAYSNTSTTVLRNCTKKMVIKGDWQKEEYESDRQKGIAAILKNCTISSSNTNVATVKMATDYSDSSVYDDGRIATVNITGVGTTVITFKAPTKTLTFTLTSIKNNLDLRDEQIAEFKKTLTSTMTDYQKMVALQDYINKNYKYGLEKDFNFFNHVGEEKYLYLGNNRKIYYTKMGTCVTSAAVTGDFCTAIGIKCYAYAPTVDHEYNYVQLDGKWYSFDASLAPNCYAPKLESGLPSSAKLCTLEANK